MRQSANGTRPERWPIQFCFLPIDTLAETYRMNFIVRYRIMGLYGHLIK